MTHIIPANGGINIMNAAGGTLRRARAMGKRKRQTIRESSE